MTMRNSLRSLSLGARPLAALALCSALAVACVVEQPSAISGSNSGDTGAGAGTGGPGPTSGSGAGSGSGGDMGTGGGAQVQEAVFELIASESAPSIELRDSREVTITIKPNGYKGPVTLDLAEPAPEGVTADLATTTVQLQGDADVTTTLTLSSLSDSPTGESVITVTGTVESGTKEVGVTLTVRPEITIRIPPGLSGLQGTQADPNQTAFGDYPTRIRALTNMSNDNPITIKFLNEDNVVHSIHAGQDAQGFPHGNDIAPGALEDQARNVNAPGTYDYYPHDIGTTLVGRIVIE